MALNGFGTLPTNTSRVRSISLTSSTPANICGTSLAPFHPLDQIAQQRWILRHQLKLDAGQIEKLTAYLDSRLAAATPAEQEILRVETDYFDKNKDRMRYPEFRAHGLFSGSGVIEAGCKTLIGARLKQSGMFWSVEGCERDHRAPLLPDQQPLRGPGFHFNVAHPYGTWPAQSSVVLGYTVLCCPTTRRENLTTYGPSQRAWTSPQCWWLPESWSRE